MLKTFDHKNIFSYSYLIIWSSKNPDEVKILIDVCKKLLEEPTSVLFQTGQFSAKFLAENISIDYPPLELVAK